jgi:hypothetical protein
VKPGIRSRTVGTSSIASGFSDGPTNETALWVPVAHLAGLPTPVELPELVAVAARWAKAQR